MKKLLLSLLGLLAFVVGGAAQTVTPNVGLQIPNYNQANWQVPLNYDLNRIDLLFSGGVSVPGIQFSSPFTFTTSTVSNTSLQNIFAGLGCTSGAPFYNVFTNSCVTVAGSGTVTSFTANPANWPTWLTPSVATSTTTPALSVAASTIPISAGGTNATAATAALANVLGNPAAGTYSVVCASSSSCTPTSAGSGTVNSGTSGQMAYYPSAGSAVSGGANSVFIASALSTPAAPTVTTNCVSSCTSTWSYYIAAYNQVGATPATASTQITNGPATVSGTVFNTITTPAVTGSTGCQVWRNVSPNQFLQYGLIGTVACGSSLNDTGQSTALNVGGPPYTNSSYGLYMPYFSSIGGQFGNMNVGGWATGNVHAAPLNVAQSFTGAETADMAAMDVTADVGAVANTPRSYTGLNVMVNGDALNAFNVGNMLGANFSSYFNGTGQAASLGGMLFDVENQSTGNVTSQEWIVGTALVNEGTVQTAINNASGMVGWHNEITNDGTTGQIIDVQALPRLILGAASAETNLEGVHIYGTDDGAWTLNGHPTNDYGLRIGAQTAGTGSNYQIYSTGTALAYFAGPIQGTTINATTGFQVGGTALAASNLSNGTTGTGSVVLAASPTLSGTTTIPTLKLSGTNTMTHVPRSFPAWHQASGTSIITATPFGPIFWSGEGGTIERLTANFTGTTTCSVAPVIIIVSCSTVACASPTTLTTLTTGTVSGGYDSGALSVAVPASVFFTMEFSSGTCSSKPGIDVAATVRSN